MDMAYNCIVYFCDVHQHKPTLGWHSCLLESFDTESAISANASPSECLMLIPSWEAFESAC
jgi:hypothetical protein